MSGTSAPRLLRLGMAPLEISDVFHHKEFSAPEEQVRLLRISQDFAEPDIPQVTPFAVPRNGAPKSTALSYTGGEPHSSKQIATNGYVRDAHRQCRSVGTRSGNCGIFQRTRSTGLTCCVSIKTTW